MSRLRDIASRSGLEDLLTRLTTGAEELAHVDPEALAAEREARKAAGDRKPGSNPRAKHADGSEVSRLARQKAADAREGRVRAERERREKVEREARDAAFREAQASAAREQEAEYQRFKASGGRSSSGSGTRSRPPIGHDRDIAKHFKTLNLSYGAEWSEVRTSYRKLMRKYHPDLHNQSPKKQKAATELTVQITQAYNALEKHLKK